MSKARRIEITAFRQTTWIIEPDANRPVEMEPRGPRANELARRGIPRWLGIPIVKKRLNSLRVMRSKKNRRKHEHS